MFLTPHPQATHARPREIKIPISDGGWLANLGSYDVKHEQFPDDF